MSAGDEPQIIRITDPAEYDRVRTLTTLATRQGYLNGLQQARLVVSREIERTAERHKVQPMEDVIRELDRLLNGGAPR